MTRHGAESQAKKSRPKGGFFVESPVSGRANVLTGSIDVPTEYKVVLVVAIINDWWFFAHKHKM